MIAIEDINTSLRKKLDMSNEERKEVSAAEGRLAAFKK